MSDERPYRCPECDTYSGTFHEEDGEMTHSVCGRGGTVASFIRGTAEYERAFESEDDNYHAEYSAYVTEES